MRVWLMYFPSIGSCLCGKISFEVKQFLPEAAHCHCTMCRKFHGAAYATYSGVKREHFRWLSGQDQLSEYRAENGSLRSFCRHCGSSLLFHSPKGDAGVVEIALATIDRELPLRPASQ